MRRQRLVTIPAGREQARRAPGHPAARDCRWILLRRRRRRRRSVRPPRFRLFVTYARRVVRVAFRRSRICSALPFDPSGAGTSRQRTTANRYGTRVRSSGRLWPTTRPKPLVAHRYRSDHATTCRTTATVAVSSARTRLEIWWVYSHLMVRGSSSRTVSENRPTFGRRTRIIVYCRTCVCAHARAGPSTTNWEESRFFFHHLCVWRFVFSGKNRINCIGTRKLLHVRVFFVITAAAGTPPPVDRPFDVVRARARVCVCACVSRRRGRPWRPMGEARPHQPPPLPFFFSSSFDDPMTIPPTHPSARVLLGFFRINGQDFRK